MHKPLPGCNREIKSNPSSQNCVEKKKQTAGEILFIKNGKDMV